MLDALYRRPWPIRIIRRMARHPVALTSSLSFGMRVGKDAREYKRAEIDAAELRARTGSHMGAISLGTAGMKLGQYAGMAVPGVGPIIGAFAGLAIGEAAGQRLGRVAAESVEQKLRVQRDPDLEPPKRTL